MSARDTVGQPAENTPFPRPAHPGTSANEPPDSNWQSIGDLAKRLVEEAQRKRDEAGKK